MLDEHSSEARYAHVAEAIHRGDHGLFRCLTIRCLVRGAALGRGTALEDEAAV